jgi:hypothetical protein
VARSAWLYVPAEQLVHASASRAEWVPAGHGSQVKGEPVRLYRKPARQMHWTSDAPAGASEKAGHPRQLPACGPEYVWASHVRHVMEPSRA